jgi:Eukaryotic protein of unknown function (DUF1764)
MRLHVGRIELVPATPHCQMPLHPHFILRGDEEGLPVYSTEELNVGQGGNTAACPFDCECCF